MKSGTLNLFSRLFSALLCFAPCASFAIPTFQGQATNLMAAHETAAESLRFIALQEGFSSGSSFNTTGSFGSDNWNYNINGIANSQSLSLTFVGSLNGDFGSDINISFTGSGNYGGTPFNSSGQLILLFDSVQGDYFVANYDDEMTYGSGTVSKTVRGAELIGGGAVGGYFGGWWGAVVGANLGWWLSDVVDTFVNSPTPPPPPPRPLPPAPPQTIPPYPPPINNNGEFSGANFSGNNITINKNRGNVIYLNGTLNTVNEQFAGTMVVPEPNSIALLLIGFVFLIFATRKVTYFVAQ